MNLRCFLPITLLLASSARAQLLPAEPDRLADYLNWFAGFDPAAGAILPAQNTPDGSQADTTDRDWSGWVSNAPVGLIGPILGSIEDLHCEVVFLGQTGNAWSSFGYRLASVDHLLCDDLGGLPFGSYHLPPLPYLETLDFYLERTDGTRYYAFNKALNTAPAADGFFGTITPLTTCRTDDVFANEDGAIPFTVLAFVPETDGTAPAEAFVFALRAGYDLPTPSVPEPATYGLAAAGLLAALGLRRRLRSTRPVRR